MGCSDTTHQYGRCKRFWNCHVTFKKHQWRWKIIINIRVAFPFWKNTNASKIKKVIPLKKVIPPSFLPSKNEAKNHQCSQSHIWQHYCMNDKLTSFVPLFLFQPHICLLIHAKFFQVLHPVGCWLSCEKQFLNQPVSTFQLSHLAKEWNVIVAQAKGSGRREAWHSSGMNAGILMALQ